MDHEASMTASRRSRLRRRIEAAGQGHVFRFWDRLDEAGRGRLVEQVAGLDLDLVARLTARVRGGDVGSVPADLEPAPVVPLPETDAERAEARRAAEAGEEALRAGRVAALVVAGGQSTRLGWDGPKGALLVGPVSEKSLFQLHTEKVIAARRRWGRPIPWLIMTSPATDRASRDCFARHHHFGMPAEDVLLFTQGTMSAVDFEGRLLLDAPDHMAESPNGHGGALAALAASGLLDELARRGIDLISYGQVDNPLVRLIDPAFIGRHVLAGAEMSSKVVRKRDADEPIGVVAVSEGRPCVVEYSDLPGRLKQATRPDGRLRFEMGSIAIHILSVDLVRRAVRAGLPFHLARKRVPCLDEAGRLIEPTAPNGVKFEMFVFDALRHARACVNMETDRDEEFAPIKNAEGADTPATARGLMVEQAARWLEVRGVRVPRDAAGRPRVPIEVSPLLMDREEEAGRHDLGAIDFSRPVYLEQGIGYRE